MLTFSKTSVTPGTRFQLQWFGIYEFLCCFAVFYVYYPRIIASSAPAWCSASAYHLGFVCFAFAAIPRNRSAILALGMHVFSGLGVRYFKFVLFDLVCIWDGLYVDAHPQASCGFLQCAQTCDLIGTWDAQPSAVCSVLQVAYFFRFRLASSYWTLAPKPFTGSLPHVRL